MPRHQRRPRVLYLTNVPAPYRVSFFNELSTTCDLTVLFERRHARDRNAAWSSSEPRTFQEIQLRGIGTAADAALCPGVLRHLRRSTFDAVVIGMYSTPTAMLAIAALRALRVPFIVSTDGGMVREESRARRTLKRALISSATTWLSTGSTATEYLVHYGAARDRISIYPFSSVRAAAVRPHPPDPAEKSALRAQLGIAESRMVLAVGQCIPRKGFDLLIRATSELPPDTCVVIAGGDPTPELRTLMASRQVGNVRFIGFQDDTTLLSYYDAADVFALPTRHDNWGLVVNEAMARGLPVVTTDRCIAGLEMVDDGVNGYLIPANDVEALARALRRVLTDDDARQAMAQAALARGREYTIETMAAAHVAALESFVAEFT